MPGKQSRNDELREGRWPGGASHPSGRCRRGRGLLTLLAVLVPCALGVVLARAFESAEGAAGAGPARESAATRGPSGIGEKPPLALREPSGTDSAREVVSADPAPRREPQPARGPRTEAEHRAVLRALLRAEPEEFGRRLASVLAAEGAACEQFAALRVAYEEAWPAADELLVRAVSVLPRASGAHAESVPQALVHWLGRRAAREPRARDVLTAIAWSGRTPVEPVLRIRALRALVSSAPESGVPALAARIHAEGDPDVHCAGRAALDERARPAPSFEASQELP
jgi:hypothetical protein